MYGPMWLFYSSVCLVTRDILIFRRLKGTQRTPGFGASLSIDVTLPLYPLEVDLTITSTRRLLIPNLFKLIV